MRYLKTVLAAAALLAVVAPGLAADMDEPILIEATDEYKPVEVGSGWYLRGDIGYAFNNEYERTERSGEFDSSMGPFVGSIGIGYHFNDYLRADINLGVLPNARFARNDTLVGSTDPSDPAYTDGCFGYVPDPDDGLVSAYRPCLQSDEANNDAYDLMANAFVDLGTYSGITPYVGGGVGLIYTTTGLYPGKKNCNSDQVFQCSTDPVQNGGHESEADAELNLQFALAAGVSYRMSEAVSLDLGYEYKFAPDAKYYTIGEGGVLETNEGLDFHSAKLGFRYDLW